MKTRTTDYREYACGCTIYHDGVAPFPANDKIGVVCEKHTDLKARWKSIRYQEYAVKTFTHPK